MAAPRLLPDRTTLKRLRDNGVTHREIAERYGVSEQAVAATLKREGLTERKTFGKELIPWTLDREHQHCYPVLMLRTLGRREQGLENTPKREAMLNAWLTRMDAEKWVVCYHPEAGPNPASQKYGGFWYEKRKRSDRGRLTRVIKTAAEIPPSIRRK